MTQRVALWLAGAMTAFVLVIMFGVGAMVLVYQLMPGISNTTTDAPTLVVPDTQVNLASNAPTNALDLQANATTNVANPTVKLTVQQATTIATQAAPRVRFRRAPELVNLDGKLAYEFVSERGAVYVDANSGAVSQANTSNRDGEKHRDEHEEDDDD